MDHLQVLFRVGAVGSSTDGELIEQFLTGADDVAEAAFAALVDRHGALVLHACRQVLGDSEDARDAFQATFLTLVRRAAAIRDRGSVSSWLYGVAWRIASRIRVDSARRRRRERIAVERRTEQGRTSDESTPEGCHELHEEIASLPDRFREPILLCYFEGLSAEAAAQRLGCARGTILSRLSRGRERLKNRLVRRGVAPALALQALSGSVPFSLPALPGSLTGSTVRGAVASKSAATGAFSAHITTLAERMSRTMLIKKFGVYTAVCFLGAIGIGGLSLMAGGTEPEVPPAAVKSEAKPKADAVQKAEKGRRPELASVRLGEYVGRGNLTNPAVDIVQRGLNLSAAQLKVAGRLAEERDGKIRTILKQLPTLNLGVGERLRLTKELTATIDRNAGDQMAEILSPGQLTRLDQIILAGHGINALEYPDIQEELRLNAGQKTEIKSILMGMRLKLKELEPQPGGPKDDKEAMEIESRAAAIYKKALNDALAVLTPEQHEIWQRLNGKPFVAGEAPPE